MKVLVIGCSLNVASRSHILAAEVVESLREHDVQVQMMDLRQMQLPLCDGGDTAQADSSVTYAIREADAVVICTPIYNYDVSAATKNLIELTGAAWSDKIVGICAAAGGTRSFMAVMGLCNNLMLDFRCLIVPRFVYATQRDFAGERLDNPAVSERIDCLARELVRIGTALTEPAENTD